MNDLINELLKTNNLISKDLKRDELNFINRDLVIDFFNDTFKALFINYYYLNYEEINLEALLKKAKLELLNSFKNTTIDISKKVDILFNKLVDIKKDLLLDIEAIYEGDPSCNSINEIVLTFNPFFAIASYRVAHVLNEIDLKFSAKIISEYAHSKTGIDINAGASIGKHFFIDHGTGIVIGETAIIGDNVKIYQGVTLGALSLKDGRKLKNSKRHPTIENNVTIYSGASILGGDTVIGENSIIGSNAFITKSIPKNSLVKTLPYEIDIKPKK